MQALYPNTSNANMDVFTIQCKHATIQTKIDEARKEALAAEDKESSRDIFKYICAFLGASGSWWKGGVIIFMFQEDGLRMCTACACFVLSIMYHMTQKKHIPWAITVLALLVTFVLGCRDSPKHAVPAFQAMLLPGTSYNRTTIGPELTAMFSTTGTNCRFENSMVMLPHSLKFTHKACTLQGTMGWMNKDTIGSRQSAIDADKTLFVRVDLNMQRCIALLYIAWIYGWIVSFVINDVVFTDKDAEEETFFKRSEVVCTASVFAGKALIFVFDYCFCYLYPVPSKRVYLFNTQQHVFMTPREWIGCPLCACVFGLFVFEVLPRLMKS